MVKISILTARGVFERSISCDILCVTLYSIPSLSETSFAALTRYSGSALCKDKRTRFLSFLVESMRVNALSLSACALSLLTNTKETIYSANRIIISIIELTP